MLTARRIVFHVDRLAAVFAHVVTIHRHGGHLDLMQRSSFCATRTERWRMHGSHRHALNQHGQGKQKGNKDVFQWGDAVSNFLKCITIASNRHSWPYNFSNTTLFKVVQHTSGTLFDSMV